MTGLTVILSRVLAQMGKLFFLTTAIALLHSVMGAPLVFAQSTKGGWMSTPKPATDPAGDSYPGCFVTFGSGSSGPQDKPCAYICNGPMDAILKADVESRCLGNLPFVQFDSHPTTKNPIVKTGDWPYGQGPQGSTSCRIFVGKPNAPFHRKYFPKGSPECGGISGEPHLTTYDDLRYDLQAAGEFIAARSPDDNLEVQVRMEPYRSNPDIVSAATAVAAQVEPYRVMISANPDAPLRIDGELVDVPEGEGINLGADGAAVLHRKWGKFTGYTVIWPDNTNLHVELMNDALLDLNLLLAEERDGRVEGILGNADGGNGENDFVTRDGKALTAPLEFDTLYKEYAESWRVKPEESLFHYEDGESTETFTDRDFPAREVTLVSLSEDVRAEAERRCRAGGVDESQALEQCIFDVGLTGEDIFISSALTNQTPPELRDENTSEEQSKDVSFDAPESGLAAHNIEIPIRNHDEGYWFGFAPEGSGPNGRAANPYSDGFVTGREEAVTLVIPTVPGKYELRYRESQGDRQIIARQPFEVRAPNVSIEAPATAKAGESVDVRLTGDLGERMTVTVVPADSSETTKNNPLFYVVQGSSEMTSVLRNLPDQPGDYEIRCVSDWSAGQVYARHALTIE